MFTWICPKCGTEVPPSYSECPTCAKATVAAAAPPAAYAPPAPAVMPTPMPTGMPMPAAAAPPPQYAAPTPAQYPQPAQYAPPVQQAPPAAPTPAPPPVMGRGAASWVVVDQNAPVDTTPPVPTFGMKLPEPSARIDEPVAATGGLPSWLVAMLSLLVVAGLGAGVVYFLRENKGGAKVDAAASSNEPTQQALEAHPSAKYIEITGLRLGDEKRKLALKFLVVNHSVGPLGGFDLEVHVKPVNAKADDPPLFTITTPVKNIGPLESRDFTVPVNTTMKAYEMPDWQFLRASFKIKNAD